jgi:hypothetical protein
MKERNQRKEGRDSSDCCLSCCISIALLASRSFVVSLAFIASVLHLVVLRRTSHLTHSVGAFQVDQGFYLLFSTVLIWMANAHVHLDPKPKSRSVDRLDNRLEDWVDPLGAKAANAKHTLGTNTAPLASNIQPHPSTDPGDNRRTPLMSPSSRAQVGTCTPGPSSKLSSGTSAASPSASGNVPSSMTPLVVPPKKFPPVVPPKKSPPVIHPKKSPPVVPPSQSGAFNIPGPVLPSKSVS